MKHAIHVTAIVAALLGSALSPVLALPLAVPTGADVNVIQVRDGCGPFAHRSHYGYCKQDGDGGDNYEGDGYRRGGYGFYEGNRGYQPYGYGYRERRCFIRETYDGPVRICR